MISVKFFVFLGLFEQLAHAEKYDIILIEIGGTVGDIESLPFLEATRQLDQKLRGNVLHIHLTYVPYIKAAGELKTKPTQHSVKTLLEIGIQPDILVCRSEHRLLKDIREKIALFCNVERDAVIEGRDASTIYEVPLIYAHQGLDDIVLRKLGIEAPPADLKVWSNYVRRIKHPNNGTVTIGLCGKYTQYQDAYKSIIEAFVHAGAANNTHVELQWIDSENLHTPADVKNALKGIDGLLVAPGFGSRGVEGKIKAIQHVRESKIPFFGICLGMQCAVMLFEGAGGARTVDQLFEQIVQLSASADDRGQEVLGALYDYACHAIDTVGMVFDVPIAVGGVIVNRLFSRDVEDEIYCTMRFAGGASGQLSVNWSDESYRKMSTRLTVWGKNGRLNADRQECQVFLREPHPSRPDLPKGWSVRYTTDLTDEVWYYLRGEEYSAQIDHSVQRVAERRLEGVNTFATAVATDRVVAMIRAAELGDSAWTGAGSAAELPQAPTRPGFWDRLLGRETAGAR